MWFFKNIFRESWKFPHIWGKCAWNGAGEPWGELLDEDGEGGLTCPLEKMVPIVTSFSLLVH